MTGRQQLARLLPLAFLLLLAIAGLRGETSALGWNGPLKTQGLVIGLLLEAVLITLLVINLVRDRRSRDDGHPDVPARLRLVLNWVLTAGVLAVGGVLLTSVNLHIFSGNGQGARPHRIGKLKPLRLPRTHGAGSHFPLAAILYGLLIAVLVAGVVLSIWWAARQRRLSVVVPARPLAEDAEDLRDAISEGRAALAELDDARAAIIACYVAMERSLADRGTARGAADTPDELLARAVASGIARGPAAGNLTSLFYEARFSSHPVGQEKRDAARQALDDLAAELKEGAAS